MYVQDTPNPLSIKIVIPSGVTRGEYVSFFSAQEALHIPVLKEILELPGVQHIFLAPEFMTVTKDEMTPWNLLQSIVMCVLNHYSSSFPLNKLGEAPVLEEKNISYTQEEQSILEEIETLIATRVRPNVEADGGTIQFDHMDMERGIVYVRLEGACSGCPHSAETLTYGIENLLKHYIPEVHSVEAVMDDMASNFST
ncbi:NifU family protein [Holospora curviuscula]|uniref:Fe/S biogenesis protein NfuA n=1 Tax=Holospora curviuscula TaxID=1082868 RepID=A0A2S5R8U1_9PROT|nr:NifU family protein [Holospora curviuscula]PPE03741.1 Fe/S biogenesis protein NfuA [Holospora curviuscula]